MEILKLIRNLKLFKFFFYLLKKNCEVGKIILNYK